MPFLLPAAATAVKVGASAAVAGASTAAVAGATVAAKVGIMATLKAVAFNALTSAAISAAMSALQPQVGSAGRTFEWTLDPNAPIPFAAGRVGVAGTVCHLETYGPDKMYYGFVSVLSGAGPIKAITGFKGDDETVTFDANGKAISSQWANEMWFRNRLGTQPDTALTNPPGLKNNAQLPGWTAAHKLSGKACYMLVLGENSKRTAYPTGEPKPLVTVEGLFGWDPRQDSTWPGGVGPCRLSDPSTWVWLDNPILWGLKWALGLWEGPLGKGAPGVDYQVGGIGAKVEGIRVDRFVAAANVADANGWKVAAYPTTDDDKSQVLDAFLQAGGAMYALEQGKISCIQRAAPRASVATITAEDTAGPLAIDTAASRIDRINTIRPRFWSEAHRWQLTAIDDVTAQAYRDEDGSVRPRGIDFPYVPLATQAGQLAALQIANTREPIAGTIPLKPHMRNVAPGTAFTISEPGFLLDGLKCLCLNTDYDPATGVVTVTFVSETDAKYPFALGQSPNPPEPPVLVAPDLTVTPPQPGDWTLTAATFQNDGVSVPALLFSGSVENARALSAIFEFRPVGATDWSGAGIEDPTVTRKEAAGGLLTPGVQYEGAVSYRVGGNISDRLILGPVTAGDLVVGDVVPVVPANVAGTPALAITTATLPDGTQTSRLYGDWADAADAASYLVEFDDGSITWTEPAAASAISEKIVVTGPSYRYRVKALSRTGHLSAAWSDWSATVGAGGDTAAPGPITAPTVTPLARRNVLTWTNPTDKDFSHLILYRNTSGTSPAATGEGPYAPRVNGSIFPDTNVSAGQTYHYWSKTVDRTGNVGALTYHGAGAPFYIRIDKGDVAFNDPGLVTEYGVSSGFIGQTDWATSPLPTSRLNYLDNSGNLSSLDRITTRNFGLLTGRTANYLDYTGGGTVDSLKPGEAGANVTESRTAAGFTGQGALATKNSATWGADFASMPNWASNVLGSSPADQRLRTDYIRTIDNARDLETYFPQDIGSNKTETRTAAAILNQAPTATNSDFSAVTGATKPSDNAGTTLTLVQLGPSTSHTTIQGNKAVRNGGSPAWDTGAGAVQWVTGACSVAARPVSIGESMFGLSSSPVDAHYSRIEYAFYTTGGTLYIYESGVSRGSVGSYSAGDDLRITYDGTFVRYYRGGTLLRQRLAAADRIFTCMFSLAGVNSGYADVTWGPAQQSARLGSNVWNEGGTTQYGSPQLVTEQGTAAAIANQGPGATAPSNRVLNDRYESSLRHVAQPDGGVYNAAGIGFVTGQLQIRLPYGFEGTGANAMIRFAVDVYDYTTGGVVTYYIGGYTYFSGGPAWYNTGVGFLGPRALARRVRFGAEGSYAYVWIGDVGTSWGYVGARVRDVQVSYSGAAAAGWDTNWSVTMYNGADVDPITLVNYPASSVAAVQTVFGENALEDSGGTVATLPNFKTPLGAAAAVAGQSPLATQTPPTYAGNSAAFAALGAGKAYLNSADSYKLATSYDPNSLTTGFGADISHKSRFGSRLGAGTATTAVTNIQNVRNADGEVTYSWARISGDATMSATSPASASTAFSAALTTGQTKTATFRCTVSDGTSTIYKDCVATVTEIT